MTSPRPNLVAGFLLTLGAFSFGLAGSFCLAESTYLTGTNRTTCSAADAATKVVAYHVFAEDAKELSVPKALEPYKNRLAKLPFKKFVLEKTDNASLEAAKKSTLDIPGKLGKAELSVSGADTEKKLEVKVLSPSGETWSHTKSGLPVIFLVEKVKSKDGKQYILIVDKGE